MIEGGAFADSGAPEHAKEQNVVENVKALAAKARENGVPVIHVHYIVEEGCSRTEAQRAAVRGREGDGRARARLVGRGGG